MKAFKVVSNARKQLKKIFRRGIFWEYYQRGYSDFKEGKPFLMPSDEEFKGVPENFALAYAEMHKAGWLHAKDNIPKWTRSELWEFFKKEVPRQIKQQLKTAIPFQKKS